ncbi:MAG: hypothetical protein GEU82_00060 [Luteitalea sp.]|nr:hypothetical protein [Luteitalea sp.]
MATGKRQDPDDPLGQDSVVEKLVPDPAAPPKLKVLIGLLGRSSREGYWRLYTTAYLNDYFEFPGDQVRHHQRLATNQSPLGGTVVWVSAEAEVLRTTSTPAAAAQEFLQGEVARALSPATNLSVGGIGGMRPWLAAVNTWVCTNQTAGTCTLVLCTRVDECRISREANPCV